MFTIYPAIDLKNGQVVRLHQGRADAMTVYGDDPGAVAREWAGQGAEWLHVVDLDGAFSGEPRNGNCVHDILAAVNIPVQLGGGLRTRQQIADSLAMGVSRCVVGTKACEPAFVKSLIAEFGGKIAVGIDARDGFVAVKGWVEKTSLTAVEFAQQISRLGVRTIIFTDIATDGTLTGPNVNAVSTVCGSVQCDIIASGGVSTADDVRRLRELKQPNLAGVIIGKALYDGRVRLSDILTSGS
jgi:phosphoribosylformimino-5-aminoimidazole carboxamide ribotide isomerase